MTHQSLNTIMVAAFLGSDPIKAIVGTNVFNLVFPDVHQYPCISIQRISGSVPKNIDRTTCGVGKARFRVSCWSLRNFAIADQLRQLTAACLRDLSSNVVDFEHVNEGEDFQDADKTFQCYTDFMVTYLAGAMVP